MKKLKIILPIVIVIALVIIIFVGCGSDKEETPKQKEKKIELTGDVNLLVPNNEVENICKDLDKDYKVKNKGSIYDLENAMKDGGYDMAVMPISEAMRFFGENPSFKAINTISLGEYEVIFTEYKEEEAPNLDNLRNKSIYIEEQQIDKDEENTGDIDKILDEKETVLSTLMKADKKTLSSWQIKKEKSEDFDDKLINSKGIFLGESNQFDEVSKEDTVILDLNSMWQSKFKNEIPKYILVANNSFIEKRANEIDRVIEDISESIQKNKESSKERFVAYSDTNRGITLIKEYVEAVIKLNKDIIGGNEIENDFYYFR